MNYIEAFSTLSETKIEGIDPYSARFNQIYGSIKKKPYDILDQRKVDFDNDFDDFLRQMGDLEVIFMSPALSRATYRDHFVWHLSVCVHVCVCLIVTLVRVRVRLVA